MKYIKTYEDMIVDNENEPQIGDYVIVYADFNRTLDGNVFQNVDFDHKLKNYINNEIGKVIRYNDFAPKYLVQYENMLPSYFDKVTDEMDRISFFSAEIDFWSSNKEDCEVYLASKKYNI